MRYDDDNTRLCVSLLVILACILILTCPNKHLHLSTLLVQAASNRFLNICERWVQRPARKWIRLPNVPRPQTIAITPPHPVRQPLLPQAAIIQVQSAALLAHLLHPQPLVLQVLSAVQKALASIVAAMAHRLAAFFHQNYQRHYAPSTCDKGILRFSSPPHLHRFETMGLLFLASLDIFLCFSFSFFLLTLSQPL